MTILEYRGKMDALTPLSVVGPSYSAWLDLTTILEWTVHGPQNHGLSEINGGTEI